MDNFSHYIFSDSSSRAASLREKKEVNKMEKLQELKRTRARKRGSHIDVCIKIGNWIAIHYKWEEGNNTQGRLQKCCWLGAS